MFRGVVDMQTKPEGIFVTKSPAERSFGAKKKPQRMRRGLG
jgi:hypothetical protein